MAIKQHTTTVSVRVQHSVKKRLEKLAKNTGRSRAFLAAQAIDEYIGINEWQIARTERAIASLNAGKAIPHAQVKVWMASWDKPGERSLPRAA